jgi:hypothetical protein
MMIPNFGGNFQDEYKDTHNTDYERPARLTAKPNMPMYGPSLLHVVCGYASLVQDKEASRFARSARTRKTEPPGPYNMWLSKVHARLARLTVTPS